MATVVLIEVVPAGFAADEDEVLVAVTPSASASLEEQRIDHRVLADLVDEGRLAALEDEHFEQQLAWFDLLDELLCAGEPELAAWSPGLSYFYSYFLKTLLDNVFIRAFEAREVVATGPTGVKLLRADVQEAPLDATLYFRGPSVLSRVLPRICREEGVPYAEVLVDVTSSVPAPGLAAPAPTRRGIAPLVDRAVAAVASLLPGRRTFAFVSTLYDAGDLLRRARRRGHRCLLVHDDAVDDLGRIRARPIAGLTTAFEPWSALADELAADDSPLWRWPDSWQGVELHDVLASRVRHFVEQVAPAIVADANRLREVFEAFRVDFVINPYMVNVREGAAAAAARLSEHADSVVIEHGDGVFAAKEIDLALLLCFDHVFVGNTELASYYETRRRAHERETARVHIGSYRWPAVARAARSGGARPPEPVTGSRPVAVYVVTGSGGDLRYLNSAWYSDAWYYRLQARLLDALAARHDYEVILKTFPGANIASPIARHAHALGVAVSTAPFQEWLPFSDRVVVDFPSTAFYECALAGVPALGLLHDHFHVRERAVSGFGGSIARFATIDDAVRLVDGFLSAPTWPVPLLAGPDTDILRTLERL